ncbi:MAG: hypothetical protein R2741_15020 [Methanolobus sp.]
MGKFQAKILQVHSWEDEFGVIFEQEILVESQNGEFFWIFDPRIICEKHMEGHIFFIEFDVWQHADKNNLLKSDTAK